MREVSITNTKIFRSDFVSTVRPTSRAVILTTDPSTLNDRNVSAAMQVLKSIELCTKF